MDTNNILSYRIGLVEKLKISFLKEQGYSVTDIAYELGITRKTVYLWLKRWEGEGNVVCRKNKGRLRKTTALQDKELVSRVKHNGFLRVQNFAELFQVSSSTIRRRLHSAGLHHRIPARKPVLTNRHKLQRLQFAREYLSYDFSKAIFSDEKIFVSAADGRLSLWRSKNTRYSEENILPRRKSGRISFGVWGWMSGSGPGELVEINGRLNSLQYTSILEEVLKPSIDTYFPDSGPIPFVQDNSAIHNFRLSRAWFRSNHDVVNLLPWPPKSPDLNPIENLWGLMAQQWDHTQAKTKESLINHVNEIWDSFRGSELCFSMVASMHERLQDVIKSDGGYTRF